MQGVVGGVGLVGAVTGGGGAGAFGEVNTVVSVRTVRRSGPCRRSSRRPSGVSETITGRCSPEATKTVVRPTSTWPRDIGRTVAHSSILTRQPGLGIVLGFGLGFVLGQLAMTGTCAARADSTTVLVAAPPGTARIPASSVVASSAITSRRTICPCKR